MALVLVPVAAALVAGACVQSATLDPGTTGGGTSGCPEGQLDCGGICVRTDIDPANCGDCGVACTEGWVCQSGHCAAGCAGGTTECDGGCVDTNVDTQHCGDCNQPCAAGDVCVGGVCSLECPGGTTKCGTQCVDTKVDPDHCGDCMTDCAPEDQCTNSHCVPLCGTGTTNCNGMCVDLDIDPDNCGACGNVCASGNCGTSLTASMATAPSSWSFNGVAYHDSSSQSAVLTPPTASQDGTIFYKYPIETDEFTLTYEFRMGGGNGGDGMAFAMQSNGSTSVGIGGGGFALVGLTGYALELDTFDNNLSCDDPGGNHAGVDLLTECNGEGAPTSIMSYPSLPFTLDDSQWHSVTITLQNNAVTMMLGSTVIASSVALPGFTPGTPFYFGFGGSGGLQYNRHEVRNISLTVPTIRCM